MLPLTSAPTSRAGDAVYGVPDPRVVSTYAEHAIIPTSMIVVGGRAQS